MKKASLAQQITKSTIANKTRLKVLSQRETVLDDIFSSAEDELKLISKDTKKYAPVLAGLIEEGLLSILEKKVTIKVRKQDLEVATKAVAVASEDFEKKAGYPVDVSINDSEFLNADLAGGVVLSNGTGKIDVDNTLEERLKLLSEESLPAIRLALFGPSSSRKFFD